MKKSIVFLGLALVAFSNVSLASNVVSTSKFELVREYKNNTPLGVAIAKGDVETAKKIIEYGGSIDEKSNGMTPLMIAARYNNVEIIKVLLERGADVKIKDEKGISALKYAEMSNAKEAADLLRAALKS
jgi:ankyrin repeat protein